MSLLLETIRIEKGLPCHAAYHEHRMKYSLEKVFSVTRSFNLKKELHIPDEAFRQTYKCRIIYDEEIRQVEYVPHVKTPVKVLKIIENNRISYPFKFADRSKLNELFSLKGKADDILIAKNGFVTDTSRANILFSDGEKWITPATPLLKGTCRQRLLDEGRIFEQEIRTSDLVFFRSFVLINAMLDFLPENQLPVQNIIY
ncbi:MAG: hypothetical protein GX437_01080 [Sphingobacteriales bacterium]|nr:hypothetical protein [Sphingobacteriales bacterium]